MENLRLSSWIDPGDKPAIRLRFALELDGLSGGIHQVADSA
jgi:hypothetical protein